MSRTYACPLCKRRRQIWITCEDENYGYCESDKLRWLIGQGEPFTTGSETKDSASRRDLDRGFWSSTGKREGSNSSQSGCSPLPSEPTIPKKSPDVPQCFSKGDALMPSKESPLGQSRTFECVKIYLPKKLEHLSELYNYLRKKLTRRSEREKRAVPIDGFSMYEVDSRFGATARSIKSGRW